MITRDIIYRACYRVDKENLDLTCGFSITRMVRLKFTRMKKFLAVLIFLSFSSFTADVVNSENQISKFERCTVSKSGRVTCKSEGSQRRVWNNGKSRGYYWTNP